MASSPPHSSVGSTPTSYIQISDSSSDGDSRGEPTPSLSRAAAAWKRKYVNFQISRMQNYHRRQRQRREVETAERGIGKRSVNAGHLVHTDWGIQPARAYVGKVPFFYCENFGIMVVRLGSWTLIFIPSEMSVPIIDIHGRIFRPSAFPVMISASLMGSSVYTAANKSEMEEAKSTTAESDDSFAELVRTVNRRLDRIDAMLDTLFARRGIRRRRDA